MNKGCLALLLVLPAVLGMRDPFLPPEDKCLGPQLALWHYHGLVQHGEAGVGIVVDAAGKWRRVQQGQRLETGWTVSRVQAEHIEIALSAGCEPAQWRWLKEGTKDAAKDRSGAVAAGDER